MGALNLSGPASNQENYDLNPDRYLLTTGDGVGGIIPNF